MEGTSVLDQNKQPVAAGPAPAGDQPVLGAAPAAPAAEQPQPVLGAAPAAPAPAAPAGQQSVLDGSVAAGPKKPITFYKKAWFWIIIAVVVLGIAGLIVFLIIQSNITAEAIANYDKNANNANSAAYSFDRKFSDIYYESGLGSYSKEDKRSLELRDKCLETLGTNREEYQAAKDVTIFYGEKAVESYGTGKTREMSDTYGKVVAALDNIGEKIDKCEDMLKDTLKNDYKITIGKFLVDKSGWYTDYGLKITVKNNSKYSIKFRIEMSATDADGKKISSNDYVYTNLIEPGKAEEYEIFDSGYLSYIDKLQNAKFEIVSVSEREVK